MGSSSGRYTDPKSETMSNRNRRRTQENIIDLTESFTLADHNNLDNVVINLDDSIFQERVVIPRPPRAQKRRHSSTRATVTLEKTVVDLSTPEGKKQPKETNKRPDKAVILEEPAAKQAKLSVGSCAICFEEFAGQALASTKCGHIFCIECLERALKHKADPRCPTCRTPLKGRNRYHPIFL